MKFRDHPLMTHRRLPNWPPTWAHFDGTRQDNESSSEIGILKEVASYMAPGAMCFLTIEVEQEPWMGVLLFDDVAFCRQITNLLQQYVGRPIREIGDIELS